MDNKINFTQEELQLIYVACDSYIGKLDEIIKCVPNREEVIRDVIGKKANEYFRLSKKIIEHMEE